MIAARAVCTSIDRDSSISSAAAGVAAGDPERACSVANNAASMVLARTIHDQAGLTDLRRSTDQESEIPCWHV
jgi:bifunctional ADP-heptose synthase (sugar kinase/adenylyltransferase)